MNNSQATGSLNILMGQKSVKNYIFLRFSKTFLFYSETICVSILFSERVYLVGYYTMKSETVAELS